MSVEDFDSGFCDKELKEIELKTWKGQGDGIIHLRALPYLEVCRFKTLSIKIANKKAINMLSGKDSLTDYNEDLGRAEDYLIKAAVCDSKGVLLFKSDEIFNNWRGNVKPDLVNEIICHIENLNELYDNFDGKEEVIELYKKK